MKNHYAKLANKRILFDLTARVRCPELRCSSEVSGSVGLKENPLDWWKSLNECRSARSSY